MPPALPLSDGEILVQRIALPDPAICGEGALYLAREGAALMDVSRGEIRLMPGASVSTRTYINLFNLGVWTRAARLGGLWLRLAGEGQVWVRVLRARSAEETDILHEGPLALAADGVSLEVGALLGAAGPGELPPQDGLIWVHLSAAEAPVRIDSAGWVTATPEPRDIRLAIAVTTYRREAEVAETAARVTEFVRSGGVPGAEIGLFVVDNGGTVETLAPDATRLANPNLGGAGGFARGLAEAVDRGFSHCLFMDDDASFQMESLARAATFLRLARSDRAAVSGAMISAARKWAMWENGAVFHGMCRPQFVGTDLRDALQVAKMELAAARPKPPGFYAGWWFFAFPVAAVERWPFPFFVRGDDISFSLGNRFDTVTLNGVVSFQEDFSAKESPLTLYLDLRNHLHQHLVHPHKEIGAWGTTKIALHFLARSIIRMHYDSAEAQLAAWEDVMRGPAFFEENADMARRRPQISALARSEAWQAEAQSGAVAEPKEPSLLYGRLLKWTLNGHLVPLWTRLARGTEIPARYRGLIWPFWGRSRARLYSVDGDRSYEVVHSKRRFAGISWRALRLAVAWRRAYPALRDAHRGGYDRLAARPFWETRFERPALDRTDLDRMVPDRADPDQADPSDRTEGAGRTG